jgi:hypothetical protein
MAMPEAATALLALWNDVDPQRDAEYNQWHAREHVPERLTVPGMLWALRYGRVGAGAMPRYLTLYGLRDAAVLDSPQYRLLLAEPTPTSRAMRPALRHIARWVCQLEVEQGIDRFERIDVRTLSRVTSALLTPPATALLVATRIPDAKELPWLSAQQTQAVQGSRLEALAYEGAEPVWPDAAHYSRLPLG